MKKAMLIDGNSLMYRGYFATSYGNIMSNSKGLCTNAIYAYYNMIKNLNLDTYDYVCIAFDHGKRTKRHDLLESYKGGRKPMPEELREQVPYVKKITKLLGLNPCEMKLVEADDIVGTMAKKLKNDGTKVEIVTGDKDLLQLVDTNVTVSLTKHGVSDLETYTLENFYELSGLKTPNLIIDYKGLCGDTSDNLKGIPKVGDKTAKKLLEQYGSFDEIIKHIPDMKGKQKENFENHKDMGVLCKTIATIDVDCEIDLSIEDIKRKEADNEKLIVLYKELEFNNLLNKLDIEKNSEPIKFENVSSDNDFYQRLLKSKISYIYLENFEFNYHKSEALAFSIMLEDKYYYLDYHKAISSLDFIKYLKENEKYTFDIKKIVCTLNRDNIEFKNATFDLMLANYIIDPDVKDDLQSIARNYDFSIPSDESVYGKGKKRSVPEETVLAEYVVTLVNTVVLLKAKFEAIIKEDDQKQLLNLETRLAYCLADMEITGITVDVTELNRLKDNYLSIITQLQNNIYNLAGMEFNINSPKQLGQILFDRLELPFAKKTKTGYSTSVDVLKKLKGYDIVKEILEYRKYSKLVSTYLTGIENALIDGKIHTIYRQALTSTGRLSSVEPNMQNIPIRSDEGKVIRKIFVSDNLFFGLDYSQIELRILAHLSGDEHMISGFIDGEDIHRVTASKIYDKAVSDITSSERRIAKTVNFGIVYGQSPFGLSEELGIKVSDAKQFIVEYYDNFPKIKDYLDGLVTKAEQTGYAITILNRKRQIKDINSSVFMKREFAKRTSMNAPIQGSAADIIKLAMVNLYEELNKRGLKSKLVLQIHDELIIDIAKEEFDEVKLLAINSMEKAYKLKVPLKVDYHSGKNLLETK